MSPTNASLPGGYAAREAQASGMVSVHAGWSCSEALVKMKRQAHDGGVTLAAVADEVLARRMRFDN